MPLIIPPTQTLADTGYSIDNSCRFKEADESYMHWTPGSAGNRKTWTVSFWFKRANISDSEHMYVFSANNDGTVFIRSGGGDEIGLQHIGSQNWVGAYPGILRDPSAWMHYVLAVDTTQGTDTNRIKLYINGEQVDSTALLNGIPAWGSGAYPSEDSENDVNNNVVHSIGAKTNGNGTGFDGYIAEHIFIDGTAYDADDFGESGTFGEWKPKDPSSLTFGSNGWHLDFSSTATKHIITASGSTEHSTDDEKIGDTSIFFDGDGDRLEVTSHSDFSFGTNPFTIEFWYNVTALNGNTGSSAQNLFIGDNGYNSVWAIGLMNDFYPAVYLGGTRTLYSATVPTLDTWYHLAWVREGSGSNESKLYINGTLASNGTGTVSTDFSNSNNLFLGQQGNASWRGTTRDYEGYLDEIRISNVARYTSNFTPSTSHFTSDANTILLIQSDTSDGSTTFVDSSGVTGALGNDSSGEDNHFTLVNIDSHDQSLDSPTNNFSTLNSVAKALNDTLSEGNLKKTGTSTQNRACSTFGFDSGKWYFEVLIKTFGSANPAVGVVTTQAQNARNTIHTGNDAGGYGYYSGGINHGGSTNGGTYSTYTTGDIIGVACDMDNLKVYFYKNGSNAITSGTAYETLVANTTYAFAHSTNGSGVQIANFGQDGTFAGEKTAQGNADGNGYGNFYYSVPSGFLAACSKNLPSCDITPSEHFSVKLYDDGAGAKTGVGFQPDLVWLKSRGSTYEHELTDAVRGVTKALSSDSTNAETTDSDGLTAFGSDGFTVGTDNNYDDQTGDGMVAWCWKAGNATLGTGDFTQGTNASTCSRNVAAGFSIVSYTGNTTIGATHGHGLSKTPELIIIKGRTNTDAWCTYSEDAGNTKYLELNTNNAPYTSTAAWNNTSPSATVFTTKNNDLNNLSPHTYIAYCFHSVEGYSKIGSYVGNANADGTFVYCGFSPAFVITKPIDTGSSWHVYDSTRSTTNPVDIKMNAHSNAAEVTSEIDIDILSNGFKTRRVTSALSNSGEDYLFIAFAETPFKNANAR